MTPRPHSPRASILIIALWSLSLLATFAVIVGSLVRQKIMLVERLQQRDQTRWAADAAGKTAIAVVRDQSRKDFDSFNDPWSNNSAVFKDRRMGQASFTLSYALDALDPSGQVPTLYGLQDEESKININKATSKTIYRLLRQINIDESLAQDIAFAIVDWRDQDSQLASPGSAEDAYYHMQRYPYDAADGDFQVLEELLLVKGVNENIFAKIRGYITIYGNGRVNANTASRPVLIALGLSEEMADRIIAVRNGKDEQPATPDDAAFTSVDDIASRLTQSYRLTAPELSEVVSLAGEALAVRSSVFSGQCSVMIGKKKAGDVRMVFDRQGSILFWQEQ